MAAPRKKKKAPPFDVTGIDFSVITTALETGGKMIEQIMNGIQYGSPEVRLLMLEECDIILECRVCRGLFRALPNFIAHKRVYCCRAYSDFAHDVHLPSASTVVPPPEQVVVVEPQAPEDVPPKNLRQPRQAKDKSKEQERDGGGADPASATNTNKKPGRAQGNGSKDNGKQPAAQPLAAVHEKPGAKTVSQPSEKSAQQPTDALQETVRQIESGRLGSSKEYTFYTEAAEKIEKEKHVTKGCEAVHLTPIPSSSCAVFVQRGGLPCDQPLPQLASSQADVAPASAEVEEKQHMKNSPREGSTPNPSRQNEWSNTASSAESTVKPSAALEPTRKGSMSKATIRVVTKVVKELRQKKEEHTAKQKVPLEDKSGKNAHKNSKPLLLSMLSESKTTPSLPSGQKSDSAADIRSTKDKPHLTTPSPTPSTKSTDQMSETEPHKEGSLRAVVKRCLTGRPGSVRVSPFKPGDWNADADNVSESGSYSDRAEPPSPMLRQDSAGEQSAMDVDNLRCTICNKEFAARKSLMYHCQSRHSGQRTIFPCPYCPRVFYYFWGLTRHLNTNHKKTRTDIDRMRKGLRRKAYKQNIIEEPLTGLGGTAEMADRRDKHESPCKFRPSVHAKKMIAASKSVSPSTSAEIKKSPPNTLYMPNRRRRVEVISSVKSRSKKSTNLYKKVYANKRAESSPGSPLAVSPVSCPFRTRKLVAKALRTTRSKRVYNRTAIDSPPVSPEKVPKKTASKITKTQPSSKGEQSPSAVCTPKPEANEKGSVKHEPREPRAGASAAVLRDAATDSQKVSAQQDDKVPHATVSCPSKPDTGTSAESKDKPQVNAIKKNEGSTEAKALSNNVKKNELPVEAKPQSLTIKKKELPVEAKPQSQIRTRTSSGVLDVGATSSSSSGLCSSQTASKVSRAVATKETSPQMTMLGRSVTRVVANTPSTETSGLLHVCPHCQRAFGRKISLDSHIKICSKTKSSVATSPAADKRPVQTLPLTQKGHEKKTEGLGTRASVGRSDGKPQTQQDRISSSSTRTLRESSVEKSDLNPRQQHKATPHPQVSKSNYKSSSSRESSADRQVTSKEDNCPDSKAVERLSRSSKKIDARASSSRDSSVDSVRTRRSDDKPHQLPAERTSCVLRGGSESTQDNWVNSRNRASDTENLLIISRQRLSEQLLAATASRDKDPPVAGLRTESRRSSTSGEGQADSKKTDPVHGTVARNSPEKSAQRTVTTTVLRKSVKGKLTDSPKKPSLESPSGSLANSVSSVRQDNSDPKSVLQDKLATKPVLQGKPATRPLLQEKPTTRLVEDAKSATNPVLQEKSTTKPLLQEKSTTKPLPQEKSTTKPLPQEKSTTKPLLQEKSTTKPLLQEKSTTKPLLQEKSTAKPLLQEKSTTKPLLQGKSTAKPLLQEKSTTKPLLQEKSTTKPLLQEKSTTKPLLQEKSTTKPLLQEKSVTRPLLQEKSPTQPVVDEKFAAKPVLPEKVATRPLLKDKLASNPVVDEKSATRPKTQDKPATRLVIQQKSATKPTQLEKPAAKSIIPEKSATRLVVQQKSAVKPITQEKSATRLVVLEKSPAKLIIQEKWAKKLVVHEKSSAKSVLQETWATPVLSQTSALCRETEKPDLSSSAAQPSGASSKLQSSGVKHQPTPLPAAVQQAEGKVFSSGQSPQEDPRPLNQRPKRKRRAPARVLDSEITLQKCAAPKKKVCLDPSLDRSNIRQDSVADVPVSVEGQTRKDPQDEVVEKAYEVKAEESRLEKKAGRPSERTRSRIYVVEPSHAGRLTCQDTRKVEEIVNEMGLTCLHCDQRFTSVSNLRRHAIRHLGWKRFKCRLCRFCSYNRSECNTHIMRSHFERVRLGSSGARIDSFITDLNRQAASVRSLKKRKTLSQQRQAEEAGAGTEEASSAHTHDHTHSSSRKTQAPSSQEEKTLARKAEGGSLNSESSSTNPPPRRTTSRGKTAEVLLNDPLKNKPPSTTSFNISTRNSPRKFDTRPYSRDDNPSTLNTRKGAYAKRNLSSFSHSLAQASAEESRKAGGGGEGRVTELAAIQASLTEDRHSRPAGQQDQAQNSVEHAGDCAAGLDSPRVQKKLGLEQVARGRHWEQTGGDEKASDRTTEGRHVARCDGQVGYREETEVEKCEFVMRKREDGDLMDVEELKTLPEHFMSDDDD